MAVVIAFVANLLVAAAKSAAALLTGSAAMLAEAAHSWADAGNEIFLLIADRAARRRRDVEHPVGYGRDAYVWSLFAAIGIFAVGATVSVTHGIQELIDPEPADSYTIAYVVLLVSAVLEGASFTQAVVQVRRRARERRRDALDVLLNGSDTTLRAVVAEDGAALVGLAVAALGILLHQLTGNPVWDALASIVIGLVLAVVAIFLMARNRRFLVGVGADDRARAAAGHVLLATDGIERVTYLRLEVVGPERLLLIAAVDLAGDAPEGDVARRLREIEGVLERHTVVERAVLTLSVADEPSLTFASDVGGSVEEPARG